MILDMLISFVHLFVLSIVYHELGHFFYLYFTGYKPYIKFEELNEGFRIYTYSPLRVFKRSKAIQIGLYLSGVFGGLLPILYYSNIYPIFNLWIIIYILGCRRDLKEVMILLLERHRK